MKYNYIYNSPIGKLYLEADETHLLALRFSSDIKHQNENQIIKTTVKQLEEYFKGERKVFDILLNPNGTEFQKKVWTELLKIPYGTTRTYKYIALACGNKNASRAVGNANNKNPIAIIIPCHRVIGSNKKLTGYAGGLNLKAKLLEIEQQQ